MPDIHSVEELFLGVLDNDPEMLKAIENCPGDIELVAGELVFTLAGLQALVDPGGEYTHSQFRKLLYSSDLAARIRARGGEIGIKHNTGKVDGNRYLLRAKSVS